LRCPNAVEKSRIQRSRRPLAQPRHCRKHHDLQLRERAADSFSFVNALLIRSAPVQAPDELWQVWRHNLKGRSALERYYGLSYPAYVYFRDNNQSFRSLAAFDPETPFVSWNQNGIGQSIQCQFVSGNFFSVCGMNTILGRSFTVEEDRQPGAAPVAMVSHAFWKNHLGSDPQIVGRTLSINGITLTVKG